MMFVAGSAGFLVDGTWSIVAVICIVGLVCVLLGALVGRIGGKSGERHRRLDLLERALDHERLDDATRQQIVQVLTREHASGWFARPENWARLCFGAGWLLFFMTSGILLLGAFRIAYVGPDRVIYTLLLLGLALLTLPLGLREFVRQDRSLADRG